VAHRHGIGKWALAANASDGDKTKRIWRRQMTSDMVRMRRAGACAHTGAPRTPLAALSRRCALLICAAVAAYRPLRALNDCAS